MRSTARPVPSSTTAVSSPAPVGHEELGMVEWRALESHALVGQGTQARLERRQLLVGVVEDVERRDLERAVGGELRADVAAARVEQQHVLQRQEAAGVEVGCRELEVAQPRHLDGAVDRDRLWRRRIESADGREPIAERIAAADPDVLERRQHADVVSGDEQAVHGEAGPSPSQLAETEFAEVPAVGASGRDEALGPLRAFADRVQP